MANLFPITVFFFLYGIQQSFCENKCYTCVSTENEGCTKLDKNKVPLKHCNLNELSMTERYAAAINSEMSKFFKVDIASQQPQLPTQCLKQVARVGGKEIVLRGCQLAPNEQLDICVKVGQMQRDEILTTHCSLCNSDGCNTAISKRPVNTITLFAIIICATFIFYS